MQTKRKEMVDICRAVKLFIQTESAHTYTGQKKWFVSKQKKTKKEHIIRLNYLKKKIELFFFEI